MHFLLYRIFKEQKSILEITQVIGKVWGQEEARFFSDHNF